MPQDLLEHQHVDTALLVHQRGCRVPQLVGGQLLGAFDLPQIAFDDVMHALQAEPIAGVAVKQRLFVLRALGRARGQVALQRVAARIVEVQDALLVAFADHAQRVIAAHVADVQPGDLRTAQPAVEQQRQDAVVARRVRALRRQIQQLDRLIER